MVLHPKYLRTWRRHEMIRGQQSKDLQILCGGVQTLSRNLNLSLCFLKKILWEIKNHIKIMRKMVYLPRLHHKFSGALGCFLNKYQMVSTLSYRWELIYFLIFVPIYLLQVLLVEESDLFWNFIFLRDQLVMWLEKKFIYDFFLSLYLCLIIIAFNLWSLSSYVLLCWLWFNYPFCLTFNFLCSIANILLSS